MAGIFSLRNWVMKQLMKSNKSGITTLPDKGKVDFGEMMIREQLFRKGIDPKSLTSESQLDNILSAPNVASKVKPKKSGEVIKVDFDKGRWNEAGDFNAADDVLVEQMYRTSGPRSLDEDKMYLAEFIAEDAGKVLDNLSTAEQNKFIKRAENALKRNIEQYRDKKAGGGRTGLSYLLAEDINERVPFKVGGIDKVRRAFLKMMGVGAATVGAAKSGLFGILKGSKPAAKELTQVPIKQTTDMPSWFKPLVNKVIKEGEEVSGDLERVITHKTKLPESKTDVYVTQDLNTGDVVVDIGMGKHGWADGYYGQPARLEYKAAEVIEPDIDAAGKVKSKGGKTKEEFNVEEAEFTGGNPENVKFEESSIQKYGEHGSDFSEVERFATGKVKSTKTTKKADDLEWARGKAEADAERWADEWQPDWDDNLPDDYASGGRAGYFLGGKVGAGILKLLKNKKKVKAAYDDIFPTGDYKYDAEMVAESLVENNPRVFKNRLYSDLTDAERFEVYGAALNETSTNFAKQLKMKRAMDKASRPTKTLEGIEKTGTIDISDDAVAEEFATFMKETDPVGHAKIQKVIDDANQQLELKRFKTKGRKKNALGGLANMLGE